MTKLSVEVGVSLKVDLNHQVIFPFLNKLIIVEFTIQSINSIGILINSFYFKNFENQFKIIIKHILDLSIYC